MCGRFVSTSSTKALAEQFGAETALPDRTPDYNVTPRRAIVTVAEHEGSRVLEVMRWGLIPSWAKDASMGDRMINARAETVAEKPAFKRALAKRRCIIPADGFYEWKRLDEFEPVAVGSKAKPKPKKQPMFIHAAGGHPGALAFAGIFERWHDPADPDGDVVVSCSIITTAANATMAPIHDRMPVILPEAAWSSWLDRESTDADVLTALLVPAATDVLEAYPVSTLVNNPRHNGEELVRPYEIPTAATIEPAGELFPPG